MSIKDFSQVIRKSFTSKTEKDFAALEESAKVAIDKDTPDVIKYMLLFEMVNEFYISNKILLIINFTIP